VYVRQGRREGITYSESLQGGYYTIGQPDNGTLSKVCYDVGNRILIGREEVIDFSKNTLGQRLAYL
jgi:hypothetical protein